MNTELLGEYLNQLSTTVLGLYNVMSGGAFANATVFALGVQPYINSSIIIQLLTIAIPALERMARDGGEEGKKKIQSITRYATVAIAILQGWGLLCADEELRYPDRLRRLGRSGHHCLFHRRLFLCHVDG